MYWHSIWEVEFWVLLTCPKRWIPRSVHLDSAQPLCLTSILVVSLGSVRYLKQFFYFIFFFFELHRVDVHLLIVPSHFSHVQLFATPMDCSRPGFSVHGFSRQEYWSGLPVPSPGVLPDPGIKPVSLMSPVLASEFFTTEPPGSRW